MEWENISTTFFPVNLTEIDVIDVAGDDASVVEKLYLYITIILVSLCCVSVAVNVTILLSVCWIRRPISPTLHISLSLAGSDLWSNTLIGIALIFNSLLPVVYHIHPLSICQLLVLEAFRMAGMYTTSGHLLALAGNHYLGIRKPLQYPALMTMRYICVIEVLLWVVPPVSFITYFSVIADDGFSVAECDFKFMIHTEFRSVCSYIFLGSLVLMAAIYIHIYLLVRKHQANRNKFRRAGSTYSRSSQMAENHQNQRRNEKALCTTLLIVGSMLLGWLPATIYFYFVCEDCLVPRNWGTPVWRIITNFILNFLLILKTAINSYIYAARMKEIKDAMRKMRNNLVIVCCLIGHRDMNGHSSTASRHFVSRTSMRSSKRTVLYRMNSIPRIDQPKAKANDQYSHPTQL
ncbi:melanocortin receptor 4-like [Cimex lectularius]|uniref:G-protein coupled receptors family 1 profile domain-containing protein n=1 Tax=Cimex lectularius TaxID=79782 RepID=A0A8I6SES9_CIMLE|nr:melanocortin receptor 4-like [Cimex lectularius]XP_024082215.1 melanocortin receptor 4-like [Cimex lectularius]XP_024082216.1 melanocortin receptor 4-like [Cimex lectularius]XP_024082217.1 melanocortin receptor 4-like [Cimex lectularius]XP_024082218.1 melanocortin receptor 4-like [Cimex lectularius]XP_024082219.1 melanocortin receptor 4-like [Cimex lectularius]